jgi:hypothetical protein
MNRVERAFRLMAAVSAFALCVGVVVANPQPAGCDSQCREVNDYSDCVIYGQFTYKDCFRVATSTSFARARRGLAAAERANGGSGCGGRRPGRTCAPAAAGASGLNRAT